MEDENVLELLLENILYELGEQYATISIFTTQNPQALKQHKEHWEFIAKEFPGYVELSAEQQLRLLEKLEYEFDDSLAKAILESAQGQTATRFDVGEVFQCTRLEVVQQYHQYLRETTLADERVSVLHPDYRQQMQDWDVLAVPEDLNTFQSRIQQTQAALQQSRETQERIDLEREAFKVRREESLNALPVVRPDRAKSWWRFWSS